MAKRLALVLALVLCAMVIPARLMADTSVHIPLLFKLDSADSFGPAGPVIADVVYEGRDECIVVRNDGRTRQDMAGWRIHSVVGNQWYIFPNGTALASGAQVRVHSGPDAFEAPPDDLLWSYAYIWNNAGDEARLLNPDGALMHSWSY